MRLTPGLQVGPYEVVSALGAGGMAEVYRARDVRLGRAVALKVVNEQLRLDPELVRRFEKEARLAGSLNHPNLITVYDVGQHAGWPFFVTELLQGETLRERLARGPVPLRTALDWGAQMARGLAAAHAQGVVHRDVKPGNVFVGHDGQVKLLDFGIAKVIAATQEPQPPGKVGHDLLEETLTSASAKTATGVMVGTPGYMSPEQVRGEPVDARTDVFSLGAVLYELLSGRRAFPGASAVEAGYAILHHEPVPLPSGIPPTVAEVVRRCLEKDVGRRLQSARDLASHLEVLRAPPTGAAAISGQGRRWWRLTAAAAVGLFTVAGVFWFAGPGQKLASTFAQRTGAQPSAPASPGASPSIAVLPFVNLSSDKEQEYFSDGVTEELLDALSRVKGLKVAGRTASFYFKGKNEELHTIGRTLGVANVVEGSVRKQGNRVRITAQLVQVADGFHLWSRTFEGELTNVFDLQEKIARAITDELKVVLQGDQRGRLVPVATRHPEAYALYLQATAIFNQKNWDRYPDAIAQVEQALRVDPGYGRAWSRLATLWAGMAVFQPSKYESALVAAEEAAHRAIELDPSLAEPQAVLGTLYGKRRQLLEARNAFRRALELDPDDELANAAFASRLISDGYARQGNQLLDRVLTVDPMNPNVLWWRGYAAFADGDLELADRLMRRSRDAGLRANLVDIGLSFISEARGQHQQAVAELTRGLTVELRDLPAGTAEATARGVLGDAQARDQALAAIQRYLATRPKVLNGAVTYALLRLGRPREAVELIGMGPTGDDVAYSLLWSPWAREARRLPEFSDVCRRIGLVQLWEHEGAPDLCRRVEPQKYVCE
jgi:TolB-like protein/Tfp pilus assembly protein PilF/tRNA A-37 threonylcarbamoyl transferase component Bud32